MLEELARCLRWEGMEGADPDWMDGSFEAEDCVHFRSLHRRICYLGRSDIYFTILNDYTLLHTAAGNIRGFFCKRPSTLLSR